MSQATQSNQMEKYLAGRLGAERGDWWLRWGAISAALVLIVGAGMLVAPMNKIRTDAQIVLPIKEGSLADLPPLIAILTKTGTFRALAMDIAFIRMEDLKQNNRFYELKQLSDWLCDLAPRYAKVWSYSAWNMAYNISVCEYTPEARWLWVSNGIENLRNKGLRYNPKSITLYKELAWIFYHKIGDKLDDYHWQYKRELAVQMELILGEPPLAMTTETSLEAMRKIATAPGNLEEWIAATPKATRLVAKLQEVGLAADEALLHFVSRHMRRYSNVADYTAEGNTETRDLTARRVAVLSTSEDATTVATLLAALRKQTLRRKLNMDPSWMLGLMEKPEWLEGEANTSLPLDWRLPFAHSLYWSTYGDMKCQGTLNIDPADSMNTVRLIFFSMQSMFRGGRLTLEPNWEHPNRSFYQTLPDTRFLRPMHYAYLYFGKEQFGDDPKFVPGTAGPNYSSGHRNFLHEAIRDLFLEGGADNLAEAKEYYFYLRNFDRENDGSIKPQYVMTFEEFVWGGVKDALETQHGATLLITGRLERSLRDAMNGRAGQSVQHFNEAKKWWEYYMRDLKTDRNARRKLEPLGVMRRDKAKEMMQAHPGAYSAVQKARLWQALDTPTRRAIYDDALPYVKEHCKIHDPPLALDKVMPIPPGMEEYRKHPDDTLKELKRFDPGVSQGAKILVE